MKFKFLFILTILLVSLETTQAQVDKATCQEILGSYKKGKQGFKFLYVNTLYGSEIDKHKFDISWLNTFEFIFKDKVLGIKYLGGTNTVPTIIYIPYSRIIKINTSANVDIILK